MVSQLTQKTNAQSRTRSKMCSLYLFNWANRSSKQNHKNKSMEEETHNQKMNPNTKIKGILQLKAISMNKQLEHHHGFTKSLPLRFLNRNEKTQGITYTCMYLFIKTLP